MKTFFALISTLGVSLFLTACGTAPMRSSTAANRPTRLQLTVDVPPSMNILIEDDVSEAFAYRVSSALHEQGLHGHIRYVPPGDTPNPNVPTLAVMLREWRVDHLGNVNCTFTASLYSPNGQRNLGAFNGTSMMRWSRYDWFDRQEDFEEAAHDAMDHLGQRIIATGLLPDLAPQ